MSAKGIKSLQKRAPEMWKHLRPYLKRLFWKKHRAVWRNREAALRSGISGE